MKEKNLGITVLLDYYGGMLTEKQRKVIELYYEDDLSLSEISELSGITRQGVRDAIKRGEATLLELEESLKLVARMDDAQRRFKEISKINGEIETFNQKNVYARFISERTAAINKLTETDEDTDGI